MIDSRENERVRKIFGENLRKLRQSRGYSQFKFAEIMGVTQAAISAWELGVREPELGIVFAIAKQFNVPVSSLIPIEKTGMDEDIDQKALDFLHQNPRWCVTFDKTRYFDERQMDVVLSVIDAIAKESCEA